MRANSPDYPTDRERWDDRYSGARGEQNPPPDPGVLRALAGLTPGSRALDLAAGTGRHALVLARAGWQTHVWDVSPVGLSILEQRAQAESLVVSSRQVDLVLDGMPQDAEFELVVLVNFLHRPLWSELHQLLVPSGHLILSVPTDDWPGDRPPPRFRVRPGELNAGLPGLETILVQEEGGRALLLAQKAGGSQTH
jgi:tellurite methyltransferase